MSRRKTFEELAWTRTKRRAARIRKLAEDIAYDWFDSDCHAISSEADLLGRSLDEFEANAKELWADFQERNAE